MESSVRKGDSLETEVLRVVKKLVHQGTLGLKSENCQVHRRKKYFSRDRHDEIEVDISIEVFVEGAETYSLLWIWECKNYEGLVPVDDVEEFHAKLEQIGSDNTKGTIISREGFQRGAVAYARSKKMGLCRLLPDDQVDNVAYFMTEEVIRQRSQLTSQELLSALTVRGFRGTNRRFYGLTCSSYGITGFEDFVEAELQEMPKIITTEEP